MIIKIMNKCNLDCFNCIYADCIVDRVDPVDLQPYLGLNDSYYHYYYLDHKEAILKRSKAYYVEHKAQRLKYQKDRYLANKEKLQEYQRKYYWRKKDGAYD